VALIESAQESVYFLAYSFTADDIGSAMLARAAEGVPVRGVFEYAQVKSNKARNGTVCAMPVWMWSWMASQDRCTTR
jgi:phosphatidylserine/phosphatidylglycerophosphate/cardiolipin synthase-like enzyme